MNSSRNKIASLCRWLALAFLSSVLLALLGFNGSAQTPTPTPNVTAVPAMVDPAKPQSILLQVKKADGTIDSGILGQVKSVTIGNQPTLIQKQDDQGITITAPFLKSGPQQVHLLSSDSKVVAQGQLLYEPDQGESPEREAQRREENRRDALAKSTMYYVFVAGMFLFVLSPFAFAIYRSTKESRATDKQPLGLPVGSFRSILAYSLVAYLGFYILTSILSVSRFAPPDFLLGIVSTVIGFYFGSRTGEGEADSKTGVVRGIVRQGTNPAPGAIIQFKRSADSTVPYTRIADLNGRFELTGAKPGTYKVSASLTGATPSKEEPITVAEGSDHEVAIVIDPPPAAGNGGTTPADPNAGNPSTGQPSTEKPSTTPPVTGQTGTVKVVVTDSKGATAVGAEVVLSQEGHAPLTGKTDDKGACQFNAVPAKACNLEASLPPDAPSDKVNVTVVPDLENEVTLQLKPAQN